MGDYEAQITIVELLMRFGGQENMQVAKYWFQSDELANMFSQIQRKRFEIQSRLLLNTLNRRFGVWGLVRSFPCKKMWVGQREILKPIDDGCDELWVDFNLVPKIIRVYCHKHPTSVDMDVKWDTMGIEASEISKYQITKTQDGSNNWNLKIELTKHGYLLFDSSALSQFPGFNVDIVFGNDIPIKETMQKLINDASSQQQSIDLIASSPYHQYSGRAAMQKKIQINSTSPAG